MRSFCIAVIAASLLAVPVVAQPLAPGKPAGVLAARHGASTGFLLVGGILVAGLVVAAVSMSGNSNTGVANYSAASTAAS